MKKFMFSKFSNSIQMKVLASILLLSLIIVSLVLGIQANSRHSEKISNASNSIHRLSESIINVKRSSAIYLSNAARDYDSYFRDLDVFYKVIQGDLNLIEQNVNGLSQTLKIITEVSQSSFNLIDDAAIDELAAMIAVTHDQWNAFKNELKVQFGDKKDEPRLEWGARYIVNGSGEIEASFAKLNLSIESLSNRQSEISAMTGQIVIAVLFFFTAIFTIFFYFQVIKPIVNTQLAFQRVSDGDFGYQIKTKSQDEIGQLVHSFNQMSARSNSVLSILSELQSVTSVKEIVDTLFSELTGYIGCDLVVYVKGHKFGNGYLFSDIAPRENFKHLDYANLLFENSAQQKYMDEQVSSGLAIQIDDMEEFMKLNKNAIAIKVLKTQYPLKSAILQPLNQIEHGAMLIFASYHQGQLTLKHLELLNHLMPFINHKLDSLTQTKEEALV